MIYDMFVRTFLIIAKIFVIIDTLLVFAFLLFIVLIGSYLVIT